MSKQLAPTRRPRLGLFGLTVAAFGLLLWARLVLVTGHPRVATADPAVGAEHQGRASAQAGGAAGVSVPVPQGSISR